MSQQPNPNGANQYTLDPRQKLCWDLYINPNSETFGNAKMSAIKSGYTEGTSDQITTASWFIDKLRRLQMLSNAERVLDKTLQFDPVDKQTGLVKTDLLRVQTDVAKHITKTLGKEDYSERIETTGKDGKDLNPVISEDTIALANQLNEINRRNKGTSSGSDGVNPNTMDTETPNKE